MTALSEYRTRATAKFPPKSVEFDDGTAITLKSPIDMNKADSALFNASLKELGKLDEDEGADFDDVRSKFVDTISDLSDNPELAKKNLSGEPISVLMAIFQEVAATQADAAKS